LPDYVDEVIAVVKSGFLSSGFRCDESGFMAAHLVPEGSKDIPVSKPVAVLCYTKADISKFKGFELNDVHNGVHNDVQKTNIVSITPPAHTDSIYKLYKTHSEVLPDVVVKDGNL
jgi:hypothetical protein